MRIVCRPLLDWPGALRQPTLRRRSQFRAGWDDTQHLLEYEANKLAAREIVIQMALTEGEIRLDGWPYARAHVRHPGITVVLPDSREGRVSFSTDRYDRWQHNVRAIALTMESLRVGDRHGVMQGRQYAGFRELGSGIAMPASQMTVEEAARFIADHSPADLAAVLGGGKQRDMAYRFAAKRLHPDVRGDPDAFQRLQEAKQVLEAYS